MGSVLHQSVEIRARLEVDYLQAPARPHCDRTGFVAATLTMAYKFSAEDIETISIPVPLVTLVCKEKLKER